MKITTQICMAGMLLLAACGQKGNLYLPATEQTAAPVISPTVTPQTVVLESENGQ